MKASIIITSFNRPHLLRFGLQSLAKQNLEDVEVIVLNDGDVNDDTENVCKSFANVLDIKYFAAKHVKEWRVPGFAINFGVKQAQGKYLFISCAEIYHMDNSIKVMLDALDDNEALGTNVITYPCDGRDDDGRLLAKLTSGEALTDFDYLGFEQKLGVHLPFFVGMKASSFVDIGGYDEDFTGICFDDDDFINRLAVNNSKAITNCRIVHLYHPRLNFQNPEMQRRLEFNKRLYQQRLDRVLVRNTGRIWGKNF